MHTQQYIKNKSRTGVMGLTLTLAKLVNLTPNLKMIPYIYYTLYLKQMNAQGELQKGITWSINEEAILINWWILVFIVPI